MREILFRGKRIGNGELVCGHYVRIPGILSAPFIISYDSFENNHWFEVDPDTVGQFTGKIVKNGKVFDGDILRSIDGVFLVCWDEEKAAFVMSFYDYPYEKICLEEMLEDSEIIGNIHNNPNCGAEVYGGNENGQV